MARLTIQKDELVKMRELSLKLAECAIVKLTMVNGLVVEGALRSQQNGNEEYNGQTHWYGSIDVDTLTGERLHIDVLDIQSAINVWDERKDAYEQAGLIRIVELPQLS